MPYTTIKDLPESVQAHLPTHGQEIYLKAFNNAWEEYASAQKRYSKEESQEAVAHKVAWAAVKKIYHKKGSKWVKR